MVPKRSGMSLEGGQRAAKLLDDRLPRGVVLLEQHQEFGHVLVPPLVELADPVSRGLALGGQDVAAGSRAS